jgi:hypothetical protein
VAAGEEPLRERLGERPKWCQLDSSDMPLTPSPRIAPSFLLIDRRPTCFSLGP